MSAASDCSAADSNLHLESPADSYDARLNFLASMAVVLSFACCDWI